ncbi:hypothetical protein V6N11_011556 [Hibiscus sabdariffa]|uniref:Uncharacterized protein n=1 Tax=Hibiscus sabdariffa TaxID=183260 RepID=A0ABR2S8L3_9ROSI
MATPPLDIPNTSSMKEKVTGVSHHLCLAMIFMTLGRGYLGNDIVVIESEVAVQSRSNLLYALTPTDSIPHTIHQKFDQILWMGYI